ncbi:hypothetical protein TLA_TLA_02353 [Tessaracoccus lapidicaptus]|nr:hypothetical protein TLA_TLA_02353 [Tessaracoccus lapidicaptus]
MIDACGIGFETRPGASHRARPQRAGWRRLRDSPGCFAPGATSANGAGATSASETGVTSANGIVPRGGGTVGRPRAGMPNPTITRLASRLDRPVPGPPHRHAPGPGHATVETSGGRREPTVGRPRSPDSRIPPAEQEPDHEGRPGDGSRLPAPSADGVGGSTPAASASRLARVLRTGRDVSERDAPTLANDGVGGSTPAASASRLARVLRTGRDLSERGRRDLSERDAATSANEAGATSAGGQPRPERTTRHPRAMSKALQSIPDGASDRTDASRP